MDEDNFVCNDSSKEPEIQDKVDIVSTEDDFHYYSREIDFCIDIQKKLRMRISTIWKEDFEQNRKMMENFKEDLNSSFRNMTLEVSIPVHKVTKYEEEINKFNTECYKIKNKKFNKNDKTSIFKRTLKTNYEKLMNELIKVRNLK